LHAGGLGAFDEAEIGGQDPNAAILRYGEIGRVIG
jgi:hypothetical protein